MFCLASVSKSECLTLPQSRNKSLDLITAHCCRIPTPPPKYLWGAAASQQHLKSTSAVLFVYCWFFQPTFERNIVLLSTRSLHIHLNPSNFMIPYKTRHFSPRPVAIRWHITPATSGTALEHHFRFAAVTHEYGRNRLRQPRTVRIRVSQVAHLSQVSPLEWTKTR